MWLIVLAVLAVVPLAAAGFVVWALWRCLIPPRRGLPIARCLRCGYSLDGITGPDCPECGADIRETLKAPRLAAFRARSSLGLGVLAWWLLVAAGSLIGFVLIAGATGSWFSITKEFPLRILSAASQPGLNVWHIDAEKTLVVARWNPPQPPFQLEVDVAALRFIILDPDRRIVAEGLSHSDYMAEKYVEISGLGPGSASPIDPNAVADLGRLFHKLSRNGGYEGDVLAETSHLQRVSSLGQQAEDRKAKAKLLDPPFLASPRFSLLAGLVMGGVGSGLIVLRRNAVVRGLSAPAEEN